ncbi:hypothetical protein N781_14285 [Pontibacillus halophilus JSM 076056 = DSM 19796]|uniref:Uncharacterized protein n=1 Tax=Pontibacillus halophilus JSM 076056 = DSM 19796 TaxID=1385510 RepID=A0A0A5GIJ9_9BACI|nr:hypothetical protein [Pontibacillus halophilus]KGX93066.1 hypothetical protein N781_14285 [Pontibacillus halophilus JSM 076056 = DSM 19796]
MGLLQSLKRLFIKEESMLTPNPSEQLKKQGELAEEGVKPLEDATCPYCDHKFDKALSRKKKCPSCEQEVYVRTLPYKEGQEKVRVAVTSEHADKIDIQWAKLNGTYEELMQRKRKYEKKREDLRDSWGQEPSESDVEWHILMDTRIEHATNDQWGLYRNTTLSMAQHLYSLKKYEESLRIYLEVLYIDLNDPTNAGKVDGRFVKEKQPFKPKKNPSLAPAIMKRIVLLKDKRTPMEDEQVEKLFKEHNHQVHQALATPLSPEEAWNRLEKNDAYWGKQ